MEIWEILRRETPTRVDEINSALQNCIDTIENTRVLLQDKVIKYTNLEKNKEAIGLLQVREKLLDIKNYLEGVKCGEVFTQNEVEMPTGNTVLIEESEELDDDEKYLVDQTIPYKLDEDFANTKPCAFELQGKKYPAKNFREILEQLCEKLYCKNQRLFEKIAREHKIKCGENGQVMICFKQDKAADKLPKNKCRYIMSSDILIYINTNTPTKIYAMRELLDIYHIAAFYIYLRCDKRITKGQSPIGKLLNIDYDYLQGVNAQPKVKPEIAVGQLAYDFFKEYFKDTQKWYDLKNFLNEIWCMSALGITCPLFKEYDPNKNIKEQTLWGNKNYPSYAQKPMYRINGKDYLICMRWYEIYRDKLEAWINEQDNTYLERAYSKKNDENTTVNNYDEHNEKTAPVQKKIGEFAKDYFTAYFSGMSKQYDLTNFLNKYWCNEHLGICYPLLKKVDVTKPISEQKNYNNEYARYWTKPVLKINNSHYIMCSQWFEHFQEKLEDWIEEEEKRENIKYTQQSIFTKTYKRNKNDCVHYDFKKNQCLCTESGVFTQHCNGLDTCKYYSVLPLHVIPKQYCKKQICPYCSGSIEKEWIPCTYRPNDVTEIQNKLVSYRCDRCEKNYISDSIFRSYTRSKNLDDLNVQFLRDEL